MSIDDFFARGCIILDACCIINFYASQRMKEILETVPKDVSVAAYVRDYETLEIYSGPIENVRASSETLDLQPFIDDGLLLVVDIETEDEANMYIGLAARLDDGEAITAAIALNRNWTVATDDLAARKYLKSLKLNYHIISTLDLMKYWADTCEVSDALIREALSNIRIRGRYEPPRDHHLIDWWHHYRED